MNGINFSIDKVASCDLGADLNKVAAIKLKKINGEWSISYRADNQLPEGDVLSALSRIAESISKAKTEKKMSRKDIMAAARPQILTNLKRIILSDTLKRDELITEIGLSEYKLEKHYRLGFLFVHQYMNDHELTEHPLYNNEPNRLVQSELKEVRKNRDQWVSLIDETQAWCALCQSK